jgi:hypothetical protein
VTAHRPVDQAVVSQPVKPAALPVTRGEGEQQVQVFLGAPVSRKRCNNASVSYSAKHCPTNPLPTTESPSRMNRTASAAVTTLSLTSVLPERNSEGSATLAVLATYP